MRKVLVTGATGFLGYHIINSLLKNNVEVTATSIEPESKVKAIEWFNKVNYISYDLNDPTVDVNSVFGVPDILIHLAWQGLPHYNAVYHIAHNQVVSFEFIKRMTNGGVENIAVSGTCFEYGMREGCLSEEMLTAPSNNYGLAKDNLRKSLDKLKNIDLTWARFFYIYGQGQNENSLLGQLNKSIKMGDTVFKLSPGDQLRDFIKVEKAADIFVRMALNDRNNGIVNICSGEPISVKEFIQKQLDMRGVKMELDTGYYPYSSYEPKNFWGCTEKLNSILE